MNNQVCIKHISIKGVYLKPFQIADRFLFTFISGCRTLKDTALLYCCETFDGSKELDKLPRSLKVELRMFKQKYFWW